MNDTFGTSHRTGYGSDTDRTDRLIEWLTKHPDATLASGEGKLLLQRIEELETQLLTTFQGMIP